MIILEHGQQGDAVVYSITGGNGNGWFEIDSATGAISLTVAAAAALIAGAAWLGRSR